MQRPCRKQRAAAPADPVSLLPVLQLIYDKETGRSKGFCFVTFEDETDATEALNDSNGRCARALPGALLEPCSTSAAP
jgi:hypothetical protein